MKGSFILLLFLAGSGFSQRLEENCATRVAFYDEREAEIEECLALSRDMLREGRASFTCFETAQYELDSQHFYDLKMQASYTSKCLQETLDLDSMGPCPSTFSNGKKVPRPMGTRRKREAKTIGELRSEAFKLCQQAEATMNSCNTLDEPIQCHQEKLCRMCYDKSTFHQRQLESQIRTEAMLVKLLQGLAQCMS